MMGLPLDPGAHAGLQGRMIALERTGGQQRAVLEGQDLRLVADQRHQHCIEFDGDGARTGGHAGHYARYRLWMLAQSSPLPP